MGTTRRILLVEDDAEIAASLKGLLESMEWEVRVVETARKAYVEFASYSPDVVLLDVQLPDDSGIDVLQQFKDDSESTPVIVMSGAGTIDRVVESMKLGAETFLRQPFEANVLSIALEQAAKSTVTRRALAAAQRRDDAADDHRFAGASTAVETLNRLLDQASLSSSPVLLEGESGSGKGFLARLIHQRSPRSKAPFVDLNCAGLSKELLESELFGHQKGAFTSATSTKPGLFEVASAGTLFLEEIGEMEISIQGLLLKTLEDWKFRRVGGLRDLRADFRLIAATHRPLRDEVASGTFRKDLFDRLNVVTIRVPPLRERAEDIPLLAQQLTAKLAAEVGRKPPRISDRTMHTLTEYAWPGNVRELRNVLERAMLVSNGREIRIADLHLDPSTTFPRHEGEVRPLEELTTAYLRAAVDAVGGNMRKAARLLQISPSTLYAKLRQMPG